MCSKVGTCRVARSWIRLMLHFVRFIEFNKEMGMKRYILIALVLSVAILRALLLNGVPIYTGT
ncbi:MAG: hypothetical protein WBI42_05670 [Candidatus Hydrothermia bacterium]